MNCGTEEKLFLGKKERKIKQGNSVIKKKNGKVKKND